MAVEFDSHHVVNLALVPIGGRPDIGNSVNRQIIFGDAQLQSQVNGERHRVKLVNNFETRFLAEIVDAGNVDQVIEREIVAAKLCHFAQIGRQNRVSGLAAEFSLTLNLRAEQFAERSEQFGAGHAEKG